MYKLVAVGGQLRGQEFELKEGRNIVGRANDVDLKLGIDGISKQHMCITVNGDSAFVEDLGSSNGTFINGKLIKKLTVNSGDKIAIPNVIFQIIHVKEKIVVVKKKVGKLEDGDDSNYLDEIMPQDVIGKTKYIFKNKVMSVIYSFNEQYEWSVLFGIILFVFIVVNISLTIGPVIYDGKKLLIKEIAARGEQFASEVSRSNAASLGRGDLDQITTTFLDNDAEGVQSYELFDLEGRIVRPLSKLNTYINDPFSIEAMKFYKGDENMYKTFVKILSNGDIGIGKAILAHQVQLGRSEPVGIVAIRFRPKSLEAEAANNSSAYLEALIITSMVGVIFFGIFYYMTLKPIDELKRQIEEVLRGKKKEISSKILMREIHPLRNSINSLLQRLKELQNDGTQEVQELEDDGNYVRDLKEFMQGAPGAVMILNSDKNIVHLNLACEDLVGMRESSASGTSLLDSARDQGFAATVIDLCDQSANNEGTNQTEMYELSGKRYHVHVKALIGRDKFAKAFYITFVMEG